MKRDHLTWIILALFWSVAVAAADKKTVSTFVTTKPFLNMTTLSSSVMPTCGNDVYNAKRTVQVKVVMNCFATNLRMVANPLAPLSNVDLKIKFGVDAGGQEISMRIPANVSNPDYGGDPVGVYAQPINVLGVAAGNVQRYRNVVTMKVPNVVVPSISAAGEMNRSQTLNMIESITAEQVLDPANAGGTYIGVNGPLSTEISKESSADGCTHTVNIRVPGAARPDQGPWYLTGDVGGFCGAYYSPLMVFFDEKRPQFTGVTDFKLNSFDHFFFWTEKNAPGYFLTLDLNQNGKIDDGTELFGDGFAAANGFEALDKWDKNHDHVIDRKDAVFKKIKLWRDLNSNGVNEPSEMWSLEDKQIVSLQTRYSKERMDFGKRARQMQVGKFKFKKNDQIVSGDILDVWFAPTSPPTSTPTRGMTSADQ